MKALLTNQAEAKSLQSCIDKSLGYPVSGENVPGGKHASPQDAVTVHYVDLMVYPGDATRWACPVDDFVEALPSDSEAVARLSDEEKAFFLDALTRIVPLPHDWEPTPFVP